MIYSYAVCSNVGKREKNEDSHRIHQLDTSLIAVIADGLGGHASGEVASGIAAEVIPQSVARREFDEDELGYAILDAHKAICATKSCSCTTVAALWIRESTAIAAHVGDSRIYQFREGQIIFQSEDHSIVQVAISLGTLPADACRNHKDRNKVYRVLGDEKDPPKMDISVLKIQPGDRFLLCSDGFWEPVPEESMTAALRESTPEAWLAATTAFIRKVNNPKQDNYSAIIIFAE